MRINPERYPQTIKEINEKMSKGFEIDEEWITNKALKKQERKNLINIRKSKIFI